MFVMKESSWLGLPDKSELAGDDTPHVGSAHSPMSPIRQSREQIPLLVTVKHGTQMHRYCVVYSSIVDPTECPVHTDRNS